MQNIKLPLELAKIWKVESDLTDNGYSIKGYDLDVTTLKVTVKKIGDPRFVAVVTGGSGKQTTVRDGKQIVCRVTVMA